MANEEEKYDNAPEIWQGKNIADFVDPDIMKKLEVLEREEEERDKVHYYSMSESEDDEDTRAMRKLARRIREKRQIITIESNEKRRVQASHMPRTTKRSRSVAQLENEMEELGVEVPRDKNSHYSRSKTRSSSRPPLKRARDELQEPGSRSQSRTPRDKSGLRDEVMVKKVKKIARKAQKPFAMKAKKGEGDRTILNMKPKHLFSGKRGTRKTDRR